MKREEVLRRLCRCSSCQIRLCIDVDLAAEVLIQIAPNRLMLNKPDKDFPHRKETLIHFESYSDFEWTFSFAPTLVVEITFPSVLELPEWNIWHAPTQRRQRAGPVAYSVAKERSRTLQCPLDACNRAKGLCKIPLMMNHQR